MAPHNIPIRIFTKQFPHLRTPSQTPPYSPRFRLCQQPIFRFQITLGLNTTRILPVTKSGCFVPKVSGSQVWIPSFSQGLFSPKKSKFQPSKFQFPSASNDAWCHWCAYSSLHATSAVRSMPPPALWTCHPPRCGRRALHRCIAPTFFFQKRHIFLEKMLEHDVFLIKRNTCIIILVDWDEENGLGMIVGWWSWKGIGPRT